AEVEIEPGGRVAVGEERVPQRQRVLATGDGHQHRLVAAEHPELADGLADLVAEELHEVDGAEGRVVAPQLEGGLSPALRALHERAPILEGLPPLMTGRSSIVSVSWTIWSAVIKV